MWCTAETEQKWCHRQKELNGGKARAAHGEWRAGKKIFDVQLELNCKGDAWKIATAQAYMECCKQLGRKCEDSKEAKTCCKVLQGKIFTMAKV